VLNVRTFFLTAQLVLGVTLACLAVPSASAQAPPIAAPRPSTGTAVAVVDISHIFKNHVRFKQQMEEMKGQVKAFEEHLRQRQKNLTDLQQKLSEYRPGTPEYKQVEEDGARLQSEVQVEAQLKRKEFLEREARVYFNVYNEVVNEISYFAERHGIALVLRFNMDQIDPEDRRSVLEGVNRAIVFQKNLNITYDILERINRGTAPPAAPGGVTRDPRATIPQPR